MNKRNLIDLFFLPDILLNASLSATFFRKANNAISVVLNIIFKKKKRLESDVKDLLNLFPTGKASIHCLKQRVRDNLSSKSIFKKKVSLVFNYMLLIAAINAG